MKDIIKTVSLEQKELILKFVANWIKDDKKISFNDDFTTLKIKNGEISYSVATSIFDKKKLCIISIHNYCLNVSMTINVKNINNESVRFIENFIISTQIQNGDGLDLNDNDFFNITNIEVDLVKLRTKKILKIKKNII